MEMEMVTLEDLTMARSHEAQDLSETFVSDLSSEMRMAFALMRPFSSPLASLSVPLEVAKAMAMASLTPSQMEVEMAESLFASFDVRELELVMFMLKPLKECKKQWGKKDSRDMGSLDMETEMVLLQQMEL